MAGTKLTLSAEKSVIDRAKRLAAEHGTSVSGLFARLITAMSQPEQHTDITLGPLTREAIGLVGLPAKRLEREILEEALAEKYGIAL